MLRGHELHQLWSVTLRPPSLHASLLAFEAAYSQAFDRFRALTTIAMCLELSLHRTVFISPEDLSPDQSPPRLPSDSPLSTGPVQNPSSLSHVSQIKENVRQTTTNPSPSHNPLKPFPTPSMFTLARRRLLQLLLHYARSPSIATSPYLHGLLVYRTLYNLLKDRLTIHTPQTPHVTYLSTPTLIKLRQIWIDYANAVTSLPSPTSQISFSPSLPPSPTSPTVTVAHLQHYQGLALRSMVWLTYKDDVVHELDMLDHAISTIICHDIPSALSSSSFALASTSSSSTSTAATMGDTDSLPPTPNSTTTTNTMLTTTTTSHVTSNPATVMHSSNSTSTPDHPHLGDIKDLQDIKGLESYHRDTLVRYTQLHQPILALCTVPFNHDALASLILAFINEHSDGHTSTNSSAKDKAFTSETSAASSTPSSPVSVSQPLASFPSEPFTLFPFFPPSLAQDSNGSSIPPLASSATSPTITPSSHPSFTSSSSELSFPSKDESIHYLISTLHFKQSDLDAAIDSFNKAVQSSVGPQTRTILSSFLHKGAVYALGCLSITPNTLGYLLKFNPPLVAEVIEAIPAKLRRPYIPIILSSDVSLHSMQVMRVISQSCGLYNNNTNTRNNVSTNTTSINTNNNNNDNTNNNNNLGTNIPRESKDSTTSLRIANEKTVYIEENDGLNSNNSRNSNNLTHNYEGGDNTYNIGNRINACNDSDGGNSDNRGDEGLNMPTTVNQTGRDEGNCRVNNMNGRISYDRSSNVNSSNGADNNNNVSCNGGNNPSNEGERSAWGKANPMIAYYTEAGEPVEWLSVVQEHLVISMNGCSIGNKVPAERSRMARMLCVYLQTLHHHAPHIIASLKHEIAAFCVEFSKVREAQDLYQLINRQSDGHMAGD